MAQVIKYQTTTVEPETSAAEISKIVRKYGASEFSQRWEGEFLVGVAFVIKDEHFGQLPIRLTARTDAIREILFTRTGLPPERREKQAYRIAWRQLKDLIAQLLLAVETGLWTLTEAFMAGIETEDPTTGEIITVSELFERHAHLEGGRLAIAPPEADYVVED